MTDSHSSHHFETLAIHAGQSPDPSTGAIMTPIFQTSTYVQEGPGVHKGYEYSRTQNPTRSALEANLAALEGAKYGLAFSSGCAAMATILHTYKAGDHFVICDDVYGGTYRLFTKVFAKDGFQFTFVDLSNAKNLEGALQSHTKMVWIETPTNPTLKVIDIESVSKIARAKGIHVLVDNTFLSPYLQSPLALGADMVLHSTTKYIGGHSDVVGGFIGMSDRELYESAKFHQNAIGAIPGPMDCFLTLRGIKTLPLRMRKHTENAMELAEFLEKHPRVEKVIYPGLKSHPQYELSRRQTKAFGGMISFVVKGGGDKAKEMLRRLQIFACAESLGGVESLIGHPATMTHASIPSEMRTQLGIVDGLVRISAGIEHIEDLKKDLDQALHGKSA